MVVSVESYKKDENLSIAISTTLFKNLVIYLMEILLKEKSQVDNFSPKSYIVDR
jgi:hypothetical protein